MNLNNFLKAVREGQSPTKAEELEALTTFAESFNDNTYLGSLFSSRLLQWTERHIQQDLSTNLMADLDNAQKERDAQTDRHATAYRQVASELADLKVENQALSSDLQLEREHVETEQGKVKILDAHIAHIQELEQAALAALENVMDAATHAWQEETQVSPDHLRGIINAYYDRREYIIAKE